jgi:thymidylate synthase
MTDINGEYANLLRTLLHTGKPISTRNSDVKRLISYQTVISSTPLVGLRKTAWKSALREMEWFLSGSTNIHDLHPSVHSWWKPWANEQGKVMNNYSAQFREFWGAGGWVDQIQLLLDGVKEHPYSRRNVITTWNTADMVHPETPITNCHGTVIQAFVDNDNVLDIATYQRSVDTVCGLPHNWVQYWALLLWVAHRTGRKPGSLHWTGGDVHLYRVHYDLAERIIKTWFYSCDDSLKTPEIIYKPSSDEFKADDFILDSPYNPLLTDRAEMVV